MTCLTTTAVLLSVLVNLSSGTLSCGINEIIDECPSDCAYDHCPKHEFQDRTPCPKPEVCPPPACKCGFNYRRAENGTCIPTTECPPIPCGENEIYDTCPICSESCANAAPSGKRCRQIGRIGITVICDPKCRCIDFYWRNDANKCVTYEECTQNQSGC
nr:inducible metalloproteinase inhibitor protein-like isoform X2 [Vanessa tameamea]